MKISTEKILAGKIIMNGLTLTPSNPNHYIGTTSVVPKLSLIIRDGYQDRL